MMANSDSTTLIQYDELVQRHDAAYTAFKSIYTSKSPPPKLRATGVDWLSVIVLGVLVVASITVSGSRTIDEFGGGLIGIAAFVMLEIALIAYAYWRTKKAGETDKEQQATVRHRAMIGMWLAFGVSLAANLHATLKHGGVETPPFIDVGILIAIAVSAPSLALIAGDMLGMEAVAGLKLKAEAQTAYDAAYAEWLDGLNTSWDRQKTRWGIRVEAVRDDAPAEPPVLPSAVSVSAQTDSRQTLPASSGYLRTPDGQRRVMEYLSVYPDDVGLPSRELAKKIASVTGVSIGHDTANKGRNAWRDQQTGDQS